MALDSATTTESFRLEKKKTLNDRVQVLSIYYF